MAIGSGSGNAASRRAESVVAPSSSASHEEPIDFILLDIIVCIITQASSYTISSTPTLI